MVDETCVVKTNNGSAFTSWENYLKNLLLHNYFFPANAYELLGFKEEGGNLLSVVKQLYIKTPEETDMEALKYFLLEIGFESIRNTNYENFELGIILKDLHDRNVLTENGVLQFIDTVFEIKEGAYAKFYDGGSLTESGKIFFEPCGGNGMLTVSGLSRKFCS